jgi:hypothetical protein
VFTKSRHKSQIKEKLRMESEKRTPNDITRRQRKRRSSKVTIDGGGLWTERGVSHRGSRVNNGKTEED